MDKTTSLNIVTTIVRRPGKIKSNTISPGKLFGSCRKLAAPQMRSIHCLDSPVSQPRLHGKKNAMTSSPVKKHGRHIHHENKNTNCSSKMSIFILKRVTVHKNNSLLLQWYHEHIEWCEVCTRLKEIYRRRTINSVIAKGGIEKQIHDQEQTNTDAKNDDADIAGEKLRDATPFIDFLRMCKKKST